MIKAHMTPIYINPDGQVCTGEDNCDGTCLQWGTLAQFLKLYNLCQRYKVDFRFTDYIRTPFGDAYMVEGWVGGFQNYGNPVTIYVGVELNGDSHS